MLITININRGGKHSYGSINLGIKSSLKKNMGKLFLEDFVINSKKVTKIHGRLT
jgi:hypothetical protein